MNMQEIISYENYNYGRLAFSWKGIITNSRCTKVVNIVLKATTDNLKIVIDITVQEQKNER